MAVTPDGINRERTLIVEVKCPYSVRDQMPEKAYYISQLGDGCHLNRRHAYYSQVQLQMHVAGTKTTYILNTIVRIKGYV